MKVLTQYGNVSQGLESASRALNTNSDIYSVRNYNAITFILHKGAGAVGTGTVTVDACNSVVPGATAKAPFYYRRFDSVAGTWGALTARTAAESFVTTAQANDIYEITVDPRELHSIVIGGLTGFNFCRLSVAQVDATVVLYGIIVVLGQSRYNQETPIDPLV